MEARGEDLPQVRSLWAHRRPCHTARSGCAHRVERALWLRKSAPCGPTSRCLGPRQAGERTSASWAARGFRPVGPMGIEISFLFLFGLNSNSKFENSCLPVESSKNHETSSVGFINLRSIYEKC
jgi:hypothetical protein